MQSYYATNTNAFWHICGDALGFRRGWFVGSRTEPPASIGPQLLHGPEHTLRSYPEAVRRLTSRGYAVWDQVESSRRKGSLDSEIRDAKHADVRSLLELHSTIQRVCFSTGKGSAQLFLKQNKSWLQTSGRFMAAPDPVSQAVFAKALSASSTVPGASGKTPPGAEESPAIMLMVMASVSPAAVPPCAWGKAKRQGYYCDLPSDRPAAAAAGATAMGCGNAAGGGARGGAAGGESGAAALETRRANAYAWKRAQWFATCFSTEPIPMRTPGFGSRESDFEAE